MTNLHHKTEMSDRVSVLSLYTSYDTLNMEYVSEQHCQRKS